MIVCDHCSVILSFNNDSVLLIAYNTHIFFDLGLTDKFFVGPAYDSISFVLFYFVESYHRKSTINFYAFIVLGYHVPRYFRLASEPNLNSNSIFIDAVTDYF